ncbi:Taurine dioxygenase, alpha-ketoglutarate-dependent [Thalassolituus maritimus]|uniref:Taurine dioxygenase, alpha-ketoglutarate-dependent n=1 Tax=Thalassolituus maritimus TaxID=484498 RepID=A0A1N7IYP5_9GAMM|nr:TauD/TfdA family dioxygenase [Thalassolituus maritimus]SIS42116.1 Taurine dioxygenase, alpha-ketoglutarate-dependent [Thalassolituus maritimus]
MNTFITSGNLNKENLINYTELKNSIYSSNKRIIIEEILNQSFFLIDEFPIDKNSEIDETFLSICSLLGSPIKHEKEGDIIMKIKPNPLESKASTPAYNNGVKFDLHSELPYVHLPPDYIALLCISNEQNIGTNISNIDTILEKLDGSTIDLLSDKAYKVLIPPHFGHTDSHSECRPMISRNANGMYDLHVRFDGILCDTNEHRVAVEKLKKVADENIKEIITKPGQILVINNRRSLHGRRAITSDARYSSRELRRIYISRDVQAYGDKYNDKNMAISGF